VDTGPDGTAKDAVGAIAVGARVAAALENAWTVVEDRNRGGIHGAAHEGVRTVATRVSVFVDVRPRNALASAAGVMRAEEI